MFDKDKNVFSFRLSFLSSSYVPNFFNVSVKKKSNENLCFFFAANVVRF